MKPRTCNTLTHSAIAKMKQKIQQAQFNVTCSNNPFLTLTNYGFHIILNNPLLSKHEHKINQPLIKNQIHFNT